MLIYGLSKKDGQWHRAKVVGIHYQGVAKAAKVEQNYQINEDFFSAKDKKEVDADEVLEEGDSGDEEDEDRIVRKLQVQFISAN